MGFFDRFRRIRLSRARDTADCQSLLDLADDPGSWDMLDDETLKRVIAMKFIEYGTTQNSECIAGLFVLYRHAMTRIPPAGRREMLTEFSGLIEQHQGLGYMGLMMFLAADTDPGIRSSAALSLSVLYNPKDRNEDELAGPCFVIHTIVRHDHGAVGQGCALGGVLLLGDKRITALLEKVWDDLSEDARLELATASSGLASEALVEFWLGRMEAGCGEAVFGSAAAAIARLPLTSQVPFVLDMRRSFPAYAGGEAITMMRRTPFPDYLEEIRPRLEALAAAESEPKVIPRIFEIWGASGVSQSAGL